VKTKKEYKYMPELIAAIFQANRESDNFLKSKKHFREDHPVHIQHLRGCIMQHCLHFLQFCLLGSCTEVSSCSICSSPNKTNLFSYKDSFAFGTLICTLCRFLESTYGPLTSLVMNSKSTKHSFNTTLRHCYQTRNISLAQAA